MNWTRTAVALAATTCLAASLCGCASSRLVDIWHDATFQAPPMNKMLIIAVRKDAAKRRIWEDAFASELVRHKVDATTSYSLFPDAPPDTNQIIALMQTSGFDGVLVVRRRPPETTKTYIQGYTSTEQDVRYSPFWARYSTYYTEITHPGYVDSQTVDIRSIDVTTTRNGSRLIWSATSETPDPTSVSDVQEGIVGLVMSELAGRGIVKPAD